MLFASCLYIVLSLCVCSVYCDYKPTWDSLDSRPLPAWYDDAKFGIFMHWGLYSVPSITTEWMWHQWRVDKRKDIVDYMNQNFKPGFKYGDFAKSFTADLFNAEKFSDVIRDSGARYYVLTSKHHEGYTMWKSNSSWNWNAVDTGPHRNLVGELAEAFRSRAPNVKFGLYFSQYDWFHPMYIQDAENNYSTRLYPKTVQTPQLYDLVNNYKPEILWSDGDWDAPDTYWQSQEFLAWLYNSSPVKDTVVSNDRWGRGIMCHHGGFRTCSDHFNPRKLQKHKWENCMTVDGASWGFRRNADLNDIRTFPDLLKELVSTVSYGGNLLMNVGPTHDGRIIPIFEERLSQMGQWLKVNGEAIYGTKPWIYQNDSVAYTWYTSTMKGSRDLATSRTFNGQVEERTTVYAIFLKWPEDGILKLAAPTAGPRTTVEFVGYPTENAKTQLLAKQIQKTGLAVDLRPLKWWKLPSTTGWVLRMRMLATDNFVPEVA